MFASVYAKDVLKSVVKGTLNSLLAFIHPPKFRSKSLRIVEAAENVNLGLMDVEHVLLEMAMFDEMVIAKKPYK